jgi:hypothetical protein
MSKARDLANFASQADEDIATEQEVIDTNFLLMGA